MDFGEEDQRGKVLYHFHHIISKVYSTNMTYDCWFDLDHQAGVVCVRCLHCTVTPPQPHTVFWAEGLYVQPRSKNWGVLLLQDRMST